MGLGSRQADAAFGGGMSRSTVVNRIAEAVCKAERESSRALGCDVIDAMLSSWRAFDETFSRAYEPAKPAVWPKGSEPR